MVRAQLYKSASASLEGRTGQASNQNTPSRNVKYLDSSARLPTFFSLFPLPFPQRFPSKRPEQQPKRQKGFCRKRGRVICLTGPSSARHAAHIFNSHQKGTATRKTLCPVAALGLSNSAGIPERGANRPPKFRLCSPVPSSSSANAPLARYSNLIGAFS